MPGTAHSGGRNKKSRALHALAGTGRVDRGTKPAPASIPAPVTPTGHPPVPVGLIGPALEEWTRMVGRLATTATLTIVDDGVLYQYVCLFAETEGIGVAHRTNVALVDKLQTAIDKLKDGEHIVRAIEAIVQLKKLEAKHTTQLRQGHMALRQYLVEFGMTPAARNRVDPTAPAEKPVVSKWAGELT